MKQFHSTVVIILFCLFIAVPHAAAKQAVFGPVKYDVKKRYGKENRYSATFTVGKGHYVVKLQLGDKWQERPEFLELMLNEKTVLKEDRYGHRVIGYFAKLQGKNALDLSIKDAKAAGFRRPALPPRFVHVTVLPMKGQMLQGAYGGVTWKALMDTLASIRKIKSSAAASHAANAADLRNDVSSRAEAVRKLSDMKDTSAQDFLLRLFRDALDRPEVRAEAALALGAYRDKKYIPLLINEVLNPDELIRTASARALSFYPEGDTRKPLTEKIEKLDRMRRTAFMRALADAGWKPVGTLIDLAESDDPHVANTALSIMGGLQDPRAVDLLLTLLDDPGPRDSKVIITALGESRDARAVEPLLKLARDREKRAGNELELADALANLGDKRGADAIASMIKKAKTPVADLRLRAAYKKLMGKDY